jgi:hypothetical protein
VVLCSLNIGRLPTLSPAVRIKTEVLASMLAAVLLFCIFFGMWFGYTLYRKYYLPGS